MTTLTSRVANQNFSRAKRASRKGPVVITERGKPALVLMRYETYQRLAGGQPSIVDQLATPGIEDIDFELPDRAMDLSRDVDLS